MCESGCVFACIIDLYPDLAIQRSTIGIMAHKPSGSQDDAGRIWCSASGWDAPPVKIHRDLHIYTCIVIYICIYNI